MRKLTVGLIGGALAYAVPAQLMPAVATAQTASKPAAVDRKAAQAALHSGFKSLQAKKHKQAITELTRAVKSGKLRSNEMAKALYYRGQAYRAANRPADAIADLTSALWMKGALSKRERTAALALRQKTYQQLGVSGPAVAFGTTTTSSTAASRPAASSQATRRPATAARTAPSKKPSSSWSTSTATAPPATTNSGSNGVASFFNSLFGGGTSSSATTGSVGSQSSGNTASAWQPKTSTSSTTRRTNVARAQPRPTNTGRYFIQVASVRDPGQAKTLANSVAKRHQGLLQGRQAKVESAVLGNMGKFYVVRIRAFRSKTEASKLCNKLLASGLDCLVNRS